MHMFSRTAAIPRHNFVDVAEPSVKFHLEPDEAQSDKDKLTQPPSPAPKLAKVPRKQFELSKINATSLR
ncbi:hypothetical protein Trydic_g5662 [Trypoxylus dichotomus]